MHCPCLCERSVCACLPYLLCLYRFEFSDFCVRSARWACTRASKLVRACALLLCDIQRGCAHVLLSMWVHAYFFSAICNERWVLISFGDICVPVCPCSCGYTLTDHPPHTLPYYPRTKHPSCPVSQATTLGRGLPLPIMCARRQNLRLARGRARFVFVLPATCTMRHQDLIPGLAHSQHPCMQPHFTPTSSLHTPLHLIAIAVLAINSLSRAHTWACPNRR